MNEQYVDNYLDIDIEYTFSSCLAACAEYRFIREIKVKVYSGECRNNSDNELIATADLKILLLNDAIEHDFDIFQIFDNDSYTYWHGESFYDFRRQDFKNAIYKKYQGQMCSENICFIESMCIKPAYRRIGLGAKIFKDFVMHFRRDSSLFVIQPFPLQFEHPIEDNAMKELFVFDGLETNKSKATKKLAAHYESWGFEKITRIKNLLFFNADVKSEKFDSINLEDELIILKS